MKEYTKLSNGFALTVVVDEDKLLKRIDQEIARYTGITQEEINATDDHELEWELDMGKVYGDYENDFCTLEEIRNDLDDFKKLITDLASEEESRLWNEVTLKKNGTFKKNAKPMLKEAVNGSYWEDSYGWNTLVMRLVPVSDTVCEVMLEHIVMHY